MREWWRTKRDGSIGSHFHLSGAPAQVIDAQKVLSLRTVVERVFDLTGLLEERRTTAGTHPLLQAFAQLAWRYVERQQLLS